MIRALRYDSDPYGGGREHQQQSGEDTVRHGSINNLGHWN